MNERFKLDARFRAYFGYLVYGKLARQNDARNAHILEKPNALGVVHGALGGGVNGKRRVFFEEKAHHGKVLHYHGVGARGGYFVRRGRKRRRG